ncbi:lysozyme [Fodinicola acaciae]|uniref:lysozyme n=1 Tax=Fodinicola acaciae TaxID=2681555 RepID=UPI0013D3B07C|nr:lysozyme [Fodinicola acaciae]
MFGLSCRVPVLRTGGLRTAVGLVCAAAGLTLVAGAIPAQAAALAAVHGAASHPDADHAGSGLANHSLTGTASKAPRPAITATVAGMDVSSHQGNVDWQTAWNNGGRFAYVKATESTGYTNPYFAQQYNGSYDVGMIRGAYHFALPNESGGAAQADYFVAHGGGWSGDGKTLPGALDIEWNPYPASGNSCYNLSAGQMVSWIKAFSDEYHAKTSRWPVIYTATSWWSACTGNTGDFSSTNPLWVANYNGSPGTLPYNWGVWTIWQYADSGTFPGDQDTFNGAYDRLQALANG